MTAECLQSSAPHNMQLLHEICMSLYMRLQRKLHDGSLTATVVIVPGVLTKLT
jgi:hypothetical protein